MYWVTTSENTNALKIHILNIRNQFTHAFQDIKPKEWYAEAIQYVYKNNIMKGYDEKTFAPNDTITRGNMITILYRLENESSIQNDKEYDENIETAGKCNFYLDAGRYGKEQHLNEECLESKDFGSFLMTWEEIVQKAVETYRVI